MPFQIIRNDITKVKADAIVNTANPEPVYGAGSDAAVYIAAGEEKLLAEREKIGMLRVGDIAVTPAFDLDAKYIIHVVSPVWIDGKHYETETLKSCYEKAVAKAYELGCKSVAFPLLATGVYGFPKDIGLQTAMNTLQSFAMHHEILIYLVTFDKDSYELGGKVFDKIESYVDEHYVEGAEAEYYYLEEQAHEKMEARFRRRRQMEGQRYLNTPPGFIPSDSPKTIEEEDKTFQEKLLEYIDKSDFKKDSAFYSSIDVSRQTFSEIRKNIYYQPKKKTAFLFCINLKLNIEESEDLLARAGFAFNPSKKDEMIIKGCIASGEYDQGKIDNRLDKAGFPTLFSEE